MQLTRLLLLAAGAPAALAVRRRAAERAAVDPLGKVLELLRELADKVNAAGDQEGKAYHKYFEWCDETSSNLKFEIKTATSEKSKLEAKISELTSAIEVAGSKIEDLAADTSSTEADLKAATTVREKEVAEFTASEGELVKVIDSLDRATGIVERQMQQGSAALAQLDTSSTESMLRSLGAVVDAAGVAGSDKQRLLALISAREDESSELGAPSPDAYESHSGGVVDLLEDLKDKAETQLSDLRKAEANAKMNYEVLRQSLQDKIAADQKDMEEEKSSKGQAEEGKAEAEGDLEVTGKGLQGSQQDLSQVQASCMQVAADHESSVEARKEELKVIKAAVKQLEKASEGSAASFVQLGAAASSHSLGELARSGIVARVRRLAQKHHSAALAHLASRIASVVRYGGGADPFSKVKAMIQDLITRLEEEAGTEANEKRYCDQELSKTEAKKEELEDDASQASAKIDQAAARSAELKADVKKLQGELSATAQEQAEMDSIRQEAHEQYLASKADLESGLASVRSALGLLRDYYASKAEDESSASMLQEDDAAFAARMRQPAVPEMHEKSAGAGTGIIGFLEVVESNFATLLAKTETQESDEQAGYEKVTFENKQATALKTEDVSFKTAESKKLDKSITELSGDKDNTETELSAVMEYYGKLKERCLAKPASYEQRKERREAEIAGLREALAAIAGEGAFLQGGRRGHVRGALAMQ